MDSKQGPEAMDSIDVHRPSLARMYDYYLGGSTNFATDRETAEYALTQAPHARTFARANRAFLNRAVRYLIDAGIDQFLDLGSGIPTVGNVHDIAQAMNPDARVAYVDIEPVAVEHARRLLADNPLVTAVKADIRDPQAVLKAPEVTELLDFSRPVAVLAVAILHAIPDADDPRDLVAAYRDVCVPGSYLALSHLSPVSFDSNERDAVREILDQTPTPVTMRDRDQIAAMTAGYTLVDPGLVLLSEWRPDANTPELPPEATNGYAALGRRD